MRSEKHGEVQTLHGVLHVKPPGARIQKEAAPLAPHLPRLRHVLQRLLEQRERRVGAPQSTINASPHPHRCVSWMADAHSRPAPTCLCSACRFSRSASASRLCSTYARAPKPRLPAAARAPAAASTRRGSGAPPRAAAPRPPARGWRRTRPWRSPGRPAASPSRAPGAARGATATHEGERRREQRGRRRRRPP